MPGTFKLDHLQPLEPILSQNIMNFFTFILGGQFLLPQTHCLTALSPDIKGSESSSFFDAFMHVSCL